MVSSIYDGRVFRQAEELTASYPMAIVPIEGNAGRLRDFTNNPKIVYGALASLVSNFRLNVINTSTSNDTAIVISFFLKHLAYEGNSMTLPKPMKLLDSSLQQLYLISGLPGVDEKLAQKLLINFRSPRNVFTMTMGDLTRVMGKSRASKIRAVLEFESPEYFDGTLQAKLS